jgi:hypothetical protein
MADLASGSWSKFSQDIELVKNIQVALANGDTFLGVTNNKFAIWRDYRSVGLRAAPRVRTRP